MSLLFLSISIMINVISNAMFKVASAMNTYTTSKIMLITGGILIGAINALCYAKSLEKIELGTAFSVFSGASIILIALTAFLFFKDTFSIGKIIGIAIIIGGIILVSKS